VLNLFLALLLSAFGAESLASRSSSEETTEAPNKLQEAAERLHRAAAFIRSRIHLLKNKGLATLGESRDQLAALDNKRLSAHSLPDLGRWRQCLCVECYFYSSRSLVVEYTECDSTRSVPP